MSDFLRRIFDTEFLPMSEVRKIKTVLVMAFLLIITAVTIPFSRFLDYPIGIKILILGVFVVMFCLMILLIRLNRVVSAIQISILYSIGLTLFYTQGSSSFYAYLFFYISLTIIIFYQELFSYIIYGTIVMALGVYYIVTHSAGLILAVDIPGSMYIYILILVLFYIVFFVQILYNEKLYADMNYDWVKLNHVIDRYQEDIYIYLDEIRKLEQKPLMHEDLQFHQLVDEIGVFIAEQVRESGKEITNVFDLYLYIHERGLQKILENDEISVSMKKTAARLDKYLLDRRTDMFQMIVNFHERFLPSEKYETNRYEYQMNTLAPYGDEQVIALAMIYQYLANEVSGKDEWDQMKRVLSPSEIQALFTGPDAEEFLTPAQVAFFKDNYDLFVTYLANKSGERE